MGKGEGERGDQPLGKGAVEGKRQRQRDRQKGRERKRQEVGKAHLLKGNLLNSAQVFLVTRAEGLSCQDLKNRPVQMPEH